MKIIISILLFTMFFSFNSYSQQINEHEHEHDCTHHANEIALAGTYVYFPSEKAYAPGLHLHYVKYLPGTKFGLGLGYEKIFDEHSHNTFGIIGSYRPTDKLAFMLSPGITLATHDKTARFSAHFETTYEFVYKTIHFGPVVGIGWDGEDYHIGAGVHAGIGF